MTDIIPIIYSKISPNSHSSVLNNSSPKESPTGTWCHMWFVAGVLWIYGKRICSHQKVNRWKFPEIAQFTNFCRLLYKHSNRKVQSCPAIDHSLTREVGCQKGITGISYLWCDWWLSVEENWMLLFTKSRPAFNNKYYFIYFIISSDAIVRSDGWCYASSGCVEQAIGNKRRHGNHCWPMLVVCFLYCEFWFADLGISTVRIHFVTRCIILLPRARACGAGTMVLTWINWRSRSCKGTCGCIYYLCGCC